LPVVFIGAVLIFYIWKIITPQDLILEARSILDWNMGTVSAGNVRWRFTVWKQMLQYGLELPFIGHGFGEQNIQIKAKL
ncbi:unnamed protein product, partial [marine sediment metagenome]